jgi:superfamily II DNA or RNA helicase
MTGQPTLALRGYQREAIDKLHEFYGRGGRRGAVVMPTGTGKTVTFSGLADEYVAATGRRVGVIAHRDELISQAAHKMHEVAPGLDIGIVQAGRSDVDSQVVVCSIQTLAAGRRNAVGPLGLLIVDEAHHSGARTYVETLQHFGAFDDDGDGALVAGFSATLVREDGGLDEIFEEVVYKRDILDFVRKDGTGALLDVRGIRVRVDDLDLSKVRRSGGDYAEGALGQAIEDSLAPEEIAKAYVEHGRRDDGTYRQGLVFTPTVASAYVIADALSAAGIVAAGIDGKMHIETRRAILREFFAGKIDVLCNCMILTEGFDAPQAEIAVIARPTTSAALYVQMVGRVLRPYPGQTQALVIDVVGVGGRHKLATLADITTKRVVPNDDESLLDAIERTDREELDEIERAEAERQRRADAALVSEDFDLFGRSKIVWHQSPRKGAWFVAVSKRIVFLAPSFDEPGRFTVARCPQDGVGGEWLTEPLDLSMAFAWAEQVVRDDPSHGLADRTARWRKGEPSDAQKDFASRLGIIFAPDVSKGDLASLISLRLAGDKLDGLNMFANTPDRALADASAP